MTALRRRPPPALLVLIAAMAAGAAALQWRLLGEPALDEHRLSPLVLAVLFAGAEVGVFHVYVRRQAQTFSLMEIPLVLGLLFVSPLTLLGARLAGSAVALVLHRRQAAVKVAFNLAMFAFETAVAGVLLRALVGDRDPLGPWGWVAMSATVVVCLVVSSAAIGIAIGIADGKAPAQLLGRLAGIGTVTTLLAADLGLVVALVLDHDATAGWLLAPGVAVIAFVVAHQGHLQARVELLEQAHQFGSEIAGTLDVEAGDARLLDRASDLLRAGWAELAYLDEFGVDVVVTTQRGRLEERRGEEARATVLERRRALGEADGPVLVAGRSRAEDVVVAVLPHPSITGTLTVGDRRGTVDGFADGDLLLVGALAAHAAVALRNRRLLRELQREIADREHRSLHDSLTGLPNRTLVDIGLDAALAARADDEVVGVLLIDLNRFKEVNDTLGHHEGDRLLVDVAGRIRSVSPPDALVGRLGGDEFAVIVRGRHDDVERAAAAVLDGLAAPFPLANLNVDVGASIGIALSPDHADDGPTLLQRADVAMYAAKARGTGSERYDATVDRNSPERLALVAELRAAIDAGEIGVEYQPVVDLRTGEVVGAEALARWHHAQRGVVPPNTFVPIAESTGLIASLTRLVLVRALRQVREWRNEGFDLGVAVNLSVRDLTDDLPALVQEQLDLLGLPADALTLEVTESSIMTDPARTIALVHRLSAMGVRISIDDFGTGYSSLSQLHWLPVDEVKIDRSFVEALSSGDAAIVRAVIDLARNLGLRAVAEGVEDGATYQLLTALDCDLVQGWFVCRPKSPAQLLRWLRERRDEAAAVAIELDGALEADPATR